MSKIADVHCRACNFDFKLEGGKAVEYLKVECPNCGAWYMGNTFFNDRKPILPKMCLICTKLFYWMHGFREIIKVDRSEPWVQDEITKNWTKTTHYEITWEYIE